MTPNEFNIKYPQGHNPIWDLYSNCPEFKAVTKGSGGVTLLHETLGIISAETNVNKEWADYFIKITQYFNDLDVLHQYYKTEEIINDTIGNREF